MPELEHWIMKEDALRKQENAAVYGFLFGLAVGVAIGIFAIFR